MRTFDRLRIGCRLVTFMAMFFTLASYSVSQTSHDLNESLRDAIALYNSRTFDTANIVLSELFKKVNFDTLGPDSKKYTCIYYMATKVQLNQQKSADEALDRLLSLDPNVDQDALKDEITQIFTKKNIFPSWFAVALEDKYRTVTITSEPTAAHVILDDINYDPHVTPIEIQNFSTFREHTIKLTREGCRPILETFIVGGRINIPFVLDCSPPPPPDSINIHISSSPQNAKIKLDGEKINPKTDALITVARGQHTITVKKGWFRKKGNATFQAEADTTLYFNLQFNPLKIASTTVVGLATGVGIYCAITRKCCKKEVGKPLPLPPEPPSK
jgi:hypothetical protein